MTLISRLGAKISRHDPSSIPGLVSVPTNHFAVDGVQPARILLQTTTCSLPQGALKASSVTSNTPKADMSHESVWFSRPRTYGKGSRQWYVTTHCSPLLHLVRLTIIAVPARTKLVSSENTGSTCAVNVSGKRHTMLGFRRYGFDTVELRGFD